MYQNFNIKSRWQNLMEPVKKCKDVIISAFILILVFFIGLVLGLLIKPNKSAPIVIDKNIRIGLPTRQMEFSENSGKSFNFAGSFVASINGKNYYPKDCPSAKKIKEENMIWFNSAQEAETDGYAPAKNCP